MESAEDGDSKRMFESTSSYTQIDPKRARFPFCIVWTPLPVISWFIPFIGHIGICREDGVILDFAGPNFVCVDNFAFGAVARYIQINKEKCHFSPCLSGNDCNQMQSNGEATWDDTLRKSTQEFQHRSYSLFTCNCHSYVANNLNRMFYAGHDRWNVVSLAALIFLKGKWVNKKSIARAYLPFVIIFALGIFLGGSSFLFGLLAFAVAITGWFIVGTYCFKNLIQL